MTCDPQIAALGRDVTALQRDVEGLREHIRLRFEASAEAQRLSAKELARRLDILNGEAERLRLMQATYVPRELWEAKMIVLDRALESNKSMRTLGLGAVWAIGVIIAIVSGGAGLAISLAQLLGN